MTDRNLEKRLAQELARRDREHARKRIKEIDKHIAALKAERENLIREIQAGEPE